MSPRTIIDEGRAARTLQAAEWFVRLSEDDVSEHELAEYVKWCSDPENLREFQAVHATSNGFDQMHAEAAAALDELLADDEPHDTGRGAAFTLWTGLTPPVWAKRAAAAAVAGVVVASAMWYARESGWFLSSSKVLVSGNANQSAVLPDGSTLMLAPRTQIAIEFNRRTRLLALSQGEAYFNVSHHELKPFVVRAGPLVVTDMGTAFNVRLERHRVVVTVQEGTVTVDGAAGSAAGGSRWKLGAGYGIAYDMDLRSASIAAVDVARVLDWQQGRREYFNEPLAAVVEDLDRYSTRPIEVHDPELGALRFTGTVFLGAIDEWLGALANTFPLRAVTTNERTVLMPTVPESGTPRPK